MKRIMIIFALATVVGLSSGTARAGDREAPTIITFDLLEKTTYGNTPPPSFPLELSKLEGKQIRISGFVTPYDEPELLLKMMLVKLPGGCFFCSPPAITDVLFVRRSPDDPSLGDIFDIFDMVDVEGILHLWQTEMADDNEAKGFFFTIDEAKVSIKKR